MQNVLSFVVCTYTSYNVYRYNIESVDLTQTIFASRILHTLSLYLCFDLCINKKFNAFDAVIFTHHICGIIVGFYTIQFIDIAVLSNVVMTIGAVEISTVFMVIRSWLAELSSQYKKIDAKMPRWLSIVEPVNNILFIGSFTYFRIYWFSKNIVFNDHFNTNIVHYNNSGSGFGFGFVYYCAFIMSMYGLYTLNIYWFAIILKSLFKKCQRVPLFSARNCEWALQYTCILSLIYVIYTYSNVQNWNPVYRWDIMGYVLLGISSYLYHRTLYQKLAEKTTIDVLDIIVVYLFDIACINLRTWLTHFTHFTAVDGYLSNYSQPIILLSLIIHSVCYIVYCWYICDLKRKNDAFTIDPNDNNKQIFVNVLICIPIVFDIIVGFVNNYKCYNLVLSLVLCMYVNGLIIFIHPFYQANHLVLHIAILWLSVILVNNNIP